MRLILRNTLLLLFVISGMQLIAQPANDDCTGAFEVTVGTDEETAMRVAGDTRSATESDTANVCSGSWFRDDIWFTFTTGDMIPEKGLSVKAFFNDAVNATDVPAVGMALYDACDADAFPLQCFSSSDPIDNTIDLANVCGNPNTQYWVRVWSGGSPTDDSGTMELAVFARTSKDNILYNETFGNGIEGSGWTTFGECRVSPDSSVNAVWEYLPDGLLDRGNFIFAGAGINSLTLCDGAVGVDSDFNDNNGVGEFGTGPVPTGTGSPADYFLRSPAIYTGDFNVAGISIKFTQAVRQFQSQYFVSFRTKDTGGDWSDFTQFEFNQDLEVNGNFDSQSEVRIFMPGAIEGDSIQIEFLYSAHYYMWGLDDVQLIETEANNLRAQANFFATAPYAMVPATEVRPYHGLIDVYNAGAVAQPNVMANHTVVQDGTGNEIYNSNVGYGSIGPDSLAENKLFPEPVVIPMEIGSYTGSYFVSSDSIDFDDSDNSQSYSFSLGSIEYAHELGSTRSVAVAGGIYDDGAPLSYAYGNVFSFPTGSQYELGAITWGVSNPEDMAGLPVNIILYDWTDDNGNEIVEFDERDILGLADYTFVGDEGANVILTTELENFENPGDPVALRDNGMYIAMVEYQANTADDPQFFLLASEAIDFGAVTFAMDSAFIKGWVDYRTYMSCLGFSPDGNIAGIDYEVKEFGDDGRVFFGNDIIPLVRLNLQTKSTGTEDLLPDENLVNVYPNPASEQMNIHLELENTFERVDLNILDVKGQLILSRTLNNVQEQVETLDVKSLPAGTYMLKVVTEDGQRTQRFVVQH